MKILVVAPYFYSEFHKGFSYNKSGFGIVINSINNEVGKSGHDVYSLINRFTKETHFEHFVVKKHNFFNFLFNIKIKYFFKGINMFFKEKTYLKNKFHILFHFLNQGFIEKSIKRIKPDVVHMHSVCVNSSLTAAYCEKNHIPYVLTLHGIITNPTVVASPFFKKEEGNLTSFISRSTYGMITCVSSGTKKDLLKKYNIDEKKILVTFNGVDKDDIPVIDGEKEKNRNDYGVPLKNHVIICCGNITENKNQIQLLNSASLLPNTIKTNLTVFLIGNCFDNRVMKGHFDFDLRMPGFVDRCELHKYYEMSDLNVLLSKSEGFGMSIIEGYLYGVPSIFFNDIDASRDLFFKDASMIIKSRDDESVEEVINKALLSKWDKHKIQSIGESFLMKKVVGRYLEAFSLVCQKRG